MQATAIGYYAARSKDTRALRRACEIHGHALQTHRASLETLHSNGCTETSFVVDVLRGTLMLSFREALYCTAYVEHINGSTKVLEMVGPEKCSSGSPNQLFFSLRSQTVRAQLFVAKTGPRTDF